MKGTPAPSTVRVWEHIDKSGADECWLWTASKMRNGYGHIGVEGRTISAHRVAWESVNGPIPAGMNVLHTCDVRACCNPAHLWLGTQQQNIQDMADKGRHPMQLKAARKRAVA